MTMVGLNKNSLLPKLQITTYIRWQVYRLDVQITHSANTKCPEWSSTSIIVFVSVYWDL